MSNKPWYVTEDELRQIIACNGAVQGHRGFPGENGRDGKEGLRGPMGPKGDDGKQGPAGLQGHQGVRGERGLDGRNGCDGKDGRDGRDGDTGPEGPTGPKGCDGKDGKDGLCGNDGQTGERGPEGPKGEKGEPGDKGETGDTGTQGIKGDTGPQGIPGPIGPQGIQGLKGDKGDRGETGTQGPQGIAGSAGADGIAGSQVSGMVEGNILTLEITDPVTQTTNELVLNSGDGSGIDTNFYLTNARCGTVQEPNTVNANVDLTFTVPGANDVVLNLTGQKLWQLFSAFESTGGPGGVTQAQVENIVNATVEARLCCNDTVTETTNADGSITYTLNQSNGDPVTWTSPAPETTGTGSVVRDVEETTLDSGQVVYKLIQSNGPDVEWSSAVPGGLSAATVSWEQRSDPDNPCVQQVVFSSSDDSQDDCILYPYVDPVCQKCYCITVEAGAEITVQGTSIDGFEVHWGQNDQVAQIAGGVDRSAIYQYNEAGSYELRLEQNRYCDDVTDWEITGNFTALEVKSCDGCS